MQDKSCPSARTRTIGGDIALKCFYRKNIRSSSVWGNVVEKVWITPPHKYPWGSLDVRVRFAATGGYSCALAF